MGYEKLEGDWEDKWDGPWWRQRDSVCAYSNETNWQPSCSIPTWGSNGGKWGKIIEAIFWIFLLFLIICYGILGGYIIPKWFINDS